MLNHSGKAQLGDSFGYNDENWRLMATSCSWKLLIKRFPAQRCWDVAKAMTWITSCFSGIIWRCYSQVSLMLRLWVKWYSHRLLPTIAIVILIVYACMGLLNILVWTLCIPKNKDAFSRYSVAELSPTSKQRAGTQKKQTASQGKSLPHIHECLSTTRMHMWNWHDFHNNYG